VAACSLALCVGSISSAQAQSAAPARAETAQQSFNIPAGSLASALRNLASHANVLLSFTPEQTQGKNSAGLKGSYTLPEALAALLANTGLQAQKLESGGYVLRAQAGSTGRDAEAALPTVSVRVSGDSASDTAPVYAGGQVARGARLGVLGNTDMMDAPFSVTSYTAQLIADQQSTTVGDVLRNDPSVRFTTSDGHNAENFTIRGFDINSSELAFNGMYGMVPGAHVPTEFLERVDVFRGPAAMVSGIAPSGSVGGVINLVPKRAGNEDLTRLSLSEATSSRAGVAADISRRLGDQKQFGIRFNGSASSGETALEDQDKRERVAAVGLDYRGQDWKLEMDAYGARQNQSNGSPLMVGFSTLGHVIDAPDASKNALRGTFAKQKSEGLALRGEYQLNRQWSVYGAAGKARYQYDGYLNGTRIVLKSDSGSATAATYNQAGYTHSTTTEGGLRGSFSTGDVGHQIVASLASVRVVNGAASVATSASYTTNLYDPISTPTLAGAHGAEVKSADNRYTSLSLADTLVMLDDKLLLTLGARQQKVKQSMATPKAYDESALTPLVGLVIKPWGESVSLYANYIEGLSPGITVGSTYANSGETLAPYKTKQAELGVKWNAGSFTNTFSAFHIKKPSTISLTGSSSLPTLALDGEQRNQGLEWTVFGQLTPQIRVLGGAVYTDAELVRASAAANNGKDAPGVPKWTANLGGEWDLPAVAGLTLNARAVYTSSQYLDAANALQIPSWTRVDAGLRYSLRLSGKPVVLRGSVENLANSNYWSGRFNEGFATLGAPRSYKLSASVDF